MNSCPYCQASGVANWVRAQAAQLPAAPVPEAVETVELEELFTFVGAKKSQPIS